MIVKEFNIKDFNLNYFVGLNQINLDLKKFLELNKLSNENDALNWIFGLIEKIQGSYKDSIVQFFNDKYVLNEEHLFTACYFVQKAFYNNINISNKKNIELFLYLATKRQIKEGIEAFGINIANLKATNLTYCIISLKNNIDKINGRILQNLYANESNLALNFQSVEKYNRIKDYFEISDNQINSVLNSYGYKKLDDVQITKNLENLFLALYDLICEKMSFLSLEKIKID